MKIGIVGHLGVVGSACKFGFEKLGHTVYGYDISDKNTTVFDLNNCELIFVCVPTPIGVNGTCDTSIVESVVKQIDSMSGFSGDIVIKSTVTPGTTRKLNNHCLSKVAFCPEFLRERCAISDFVENHDLLVAGTDDYNLAKKIFELHGNYPKQIIQLSPEEAEMVKYFSNGINALRIIFANVVQEICEHVGADYKKVKDAYIMRGQMPDQYLDCNENFRGYAGTCLPKDVKALENLESPCYGLFKKMDEINEQLEKTVFEGMRK